MPSPAHTSRSTPLFGRLTSAPATAPHAEAPSFTPLSITRSTDLARRARRVAIGNFDGVHLGHAATIRGCDTVLTFDPHPKALLSREAVPETLTSLEEKAEILAQLGVRELVVLAFDEAVAAQAPDAFVRQTLIERLGAVHVSVGENFRYGARASGDVSALRTYGAFTTSVKELVRVDGEVVSSSRIREALRVGDVAAAARLLGRPHQVPARAIGIDVDGSNADARLLRLELHAGHACPPPGVYRCTLALAGSTGPQIRRRVEVLPAAAQAAGGQTVQARVLGRPERAWRERPVVVRFRERDGLRTASPSPPPAGAMP